VAEPFRDGLEAAMERAERLADENEDLREEVERLRHDAADAPTTNTPATAPQDAQQERILHLLDDLAEERETKPQTSIAEQLAPLVMAEPHAEQRVPEPRVNENVLARATHVEPLATKALITTPIPVDRAVEERVRGAFKAGVAVGVTLSAIIALVIAVLLGGAR
jgi:hypothetical protein